MDTRRNIYTLSDTALADFLTAVNALKADGAYDNFVRRHHQAMSRATVLPNEPPTMRNVAHRGPAFLPWHRYFIREFEVALQSKVSGVALPYWDWAADASNPSGAPLWNSNATSGRIYIGGDGQLPGDLVGTGPFAGWRILIQQGNQLVVRPGPAGLIRRLGRDPLAAGSPHFPTQAQANQSLTISVYDGSPWNERPDTNPSFRNRWEGWIRQAGEQGSQLHNRVHLWVGGDMMPGTSPNDPVFFLHHCNVDRIWAKWQQTYPSAAYLPSASGPPQHNLNDVMSELTASNATPARCLDYQTNLGYAYDVL